MKKSELQQIIKEEISNVLSENKLTLERQKRLDSLRAELMSATDPSNYDYDGRNESEIINDIRKEFGDQIAKQIEDGSYEMHYSRQDNFATDKLADKVKYGRTSHRVTKGGKMNQQDVEKIKNYYKRGY